MLRCHLAGHMYSMSEFVGSVPELAGALQVRALVLRAEVAPLAAARSVPLHEYGLAFLFVICRWPFALSSCHSLSTLGSLRCSNCPKRAMKRP